MCRPSRFQNIWGMLLSKKIWVPWVPTPLCQVALSDSGGPAMIFTPRWKGNWPDNLSSGRTQWSCSNILLSYLAVVHLGLHHTLHVFLLHGRWHPEAVPHTQDLRPAVGIRHFHRTVENHRPGIQLYKNTRRWWLDVRRREESMKSKQQKWNRGRNCNNDEIMNTNVPNSCC